MFKSKLFWLFAAVVFAAFLRVGLREKTPPQPQAQSVAKPSQEDPAEGVRGAGWMAAKKVLPSALEHPAEAEYPWESVTHEKQADGSWLVSGDVIDKNEAGVKSTLRYGVVILEAGDRLNASKVILDGRTIFDATR